MNRRLWLIAASIILVILAGVFLLLNTKKLKTPLTVKRDAVDSVSGLINQAKDFQIKGDLLAAKGLYQRLISEFPNSSEVANWQKKVEQINIELLFSPTVTPKSSLYEIEPGDTLTKIARQFNTTVELIKKSNGFTDDKILPGRKIKIWTAPFSILIDKSQNTLILKSEEEIIKTYIVSTGTNNSTPTGNFKIVNKLPNPTWFKTGAVVPPGSPKNILGLYWLGLDLSGYGIHGTTDPQSLGRQITQGCVRMSNSDVEELYTIIPVGIEVTIVD